MLVWKEKTPASLSGGRLAGGVVTRVSGRMFLSESQWDNQTVSPPVEPAVIMEPQRAEFYDCLNVLAHTL